MNRPVCLDTFCKAGGAGMGYHRAGYRVVGVDIEPQPHYPFEFIQADAIEFIRRHGSEYDLIHASPPCQAYSITASLSKGGYPMLIDATRAALVATGKPYVIENVPGAPLINPLMLCGTMFGLRVIRHRLFECSPAIWFPPMACNHDGTASGNRNKKGVRKTLENYRFLTIVGNDYIANDGRIAMGIEWMTRAELSQAIPPAYTEFIGRQMLRYVRSNNRLHLTAGIQPQIEMFNPEGDPGQPGDTTTARRK